MCQPNVIGILAFHVSDESALAGWQSGPYYADDTAKSSLQAIRDAANAAHAGTLTTCPDTTPPSVVLTSPAAGTPVGPGGVTVTAAASDNVGVGRVELLANGTLLATKYAAPYSFTWTPTQSGPVILEVRAYDAAGNAGNASTTVTAHLGPPETTVTAAPPSSTTATDPSFAFTSSEAMSTFKCSLDGSAFAPCTSPAGYSGLAVGAHTFQVVAIDAAADVDPSPAAYSWTIVATDITSPETTVTAGPPSPTTATDASFAFTSSETASTFKCSVDGEAFTTCSPPSSYTGLAVGPHGFQVVAIDPAGNIDPTPATFAWTVEAAPAPAPPPSGGSGGGGSSSGGGSVPAGNPADDAASLMLSPAAPAVGAAAAEPKAISPPRIRGLARPGAVLRASPAVWSATPSKIAYHWQRCTTRGCAPIRGATRRTLRLVPAEAGRSVRIVATATIQGRTIISASRRVLVERR